jgi:hypothetical protein
MRRKRAAKAPKRAVGSRRTARFRKSRARLRLSERPTDWKCAMLGGQRRPKLRIDSLRNRAAFGAIGIVGGNQKNEGTKLLTAMESADPLKSKAGFQRHSPELYMAWRARAANGDRRLRIDSLRNRTAFGARGIADGNQKMKEQSWISAT